MKISSAFILLAGIILGTGCASTGNSPTRTQVATVIPEITATRAVISTATATTRPEATTASQPTVEPTPTVEATSLPRPLPDAAQPRPFAIELTPLVASGLTRPTYLTHAGDDRLFVVEQPGRTRIIQDGQLLDQPFLDITDKVTTGGNEQGLLSVAFHPDYKNNGQFFVNYTRRRDGATVIERYMVSGDPNVADKNSATEILVIGQPQANHNGGQLQFGPDGYLYIGMGDGGGAGDQHGSIGNGQDFDSLLGKLLRIDVTSQDTYAIPAANPLGNEIWAYGLRNPWRFSFDRTTGDLYIADVGQNVYEEVNFQAAASAGGENYGWRIMEGLHCYNPRDGCDQSGLALPIAEYSHAEGGCSITGGYVYRGLQFPVLDGAYFFGDYCTGFVWSLQRVDDHWQMTKRLESGVRISSFGEDVNGELYIVDHGGAVYQLIAQ